jgi:hypothetical protein
MGFRLQRNLGPVAHLTRGQYTVETASGRPAICCPGCEEVSELAETHRVLTGGIVSLVWACPDGRCPYMDFITLESWGEPVVPA